MSEYKYKKVPMRARSIQMVFFSLTTLLAISALLPVTFLLVYVFMKGIPAFSISFLFSTSTSIVSGGIWPAIWGSFVLTLITMLFSVPLGVFAAIYLSEYASKRWYIRMLNFAILNLSNLPSVVYGLFGLGVFVTLFKMGVSLLAGALTLSALALPLIISQCYRHLQNVPAELREAAYSVGATRFETTFRVTLPSAAADLIQTFFETAVRIATETAPIMFTAAAYFLPHTVMNITNKSMLLPYHLFATTTMVYGIDENQKYAIALTLIFIVLLFSATGYFIRRIIRRRLQINF